MDTTRWGSLDWDTFAFSFGHRLVLLRKMRKLSQEALAERSGLHRNQISNLERGTSNHEPYVSDPMLSTVYRLARALDVAPSSLLPDVDVPVTPRSAEQASVERLSLVEQELRDIIDRESD